MDMIKINFKMINYILKNLYRFWSLKPFYPDRESLTLKVFWDLCTMRLFSNVRVACFWLGLYVPCSPPVETRLELTSEACPFKYLAVLVQYQGKICHLTFWRHVRPGMMLPKATEAQSKNDNSFRSWWRRIPHHETGYLVSWWGTHTSWRPLNLCRCHQYWWTFIRFPYLSLVISRNGCDPQAIDFPFMAHFTRS
jgi:hypothetical protein